MYEGSEISSYANDFNGAMREQRGENKIERRCEQETKIFHYRRTTISLFMLCVSLPRNGASEGRQRVLIHVGRNTQ